ncbi:MAG: HIT family protein [Candidatus Kapabacteria bacterium]|nr:HIT family protein [Candidatus Kapabacteria bacterium]
MKDFTSIDSSRVLFKNDYFFIIKDGFPVSPGHLLIISNQVRKDYFELTNSEKENLTEVISVAKKMVDTEYNPDGYNIGMNCGEAAGQTVFHFHCHLIPRYFGDMENPRGGVRHCITGKGFY